MSTDEHTPPEEHERDASSLPEELAWRWPFGPAFFLQQLQGFVRDRCPNPDEHLPGVELHLAGGDVLEICHIIGISPLWVALAVYESERASRESSSMRTELVPFEMVSRITIRSARKELARLGFELGKTPTVWNAAAKDRFSPEDALRAAARPRGATHRS